LKGGLFIDLQASTRAAEKCQVSKYYCAEGVRGDKNDLRWGIDFNELYPNAGALTIKEDKLWGKVHINGGQWYTSNLSEFKWRMVSADVNKPAAALNFDRQVGATSAQIEMDAGDVLVVRGSDVDLRLDGGNGYGYSIDITNLTIPSLASIDHFLMYFDIIEQELGRYVPVMASRMGFNPAPKMCDAILLSGTSLSVP
jgi:hypothetical protein